MPCPFDISLNLRCPDPKCVDPHCTYLHKCKQGRSCGHRWQSIDKFGTKSLGLKRLLHCFACKETCDKTNAKCKTNAKHNAKNSAKIKTNTKLSPDKSQEIHKFNAITTTIIRLSTELSSQTF